MVKKSGRNPFRLCDPNQTVAIPSPFTRKADLDTESTCFSTVAPGSDSFSSREDFTLVAGSGGLDNQAWITNWIYSTGNNMDSQQASYVPRDTNGSSWKCPSPTTSGSGSVQMYAEDAYSVNYSSSGNETLDFTSISSPDTGHAFVPTKSADGSAFQNPIDDTSVSQGQMTEPFSVFPDDYVATGPSPQMMLPQSDNLDSQSMANALPGYGTNAINIRTQYSQDQVSGMSPLDVSCQFDGALAGKGIVNSTQHSNFPFVSAANLPTEEELISDDTSFDTIAWGQNGVFMMSHSNQGLGSAISPLDLNEAALQAGAMIPLARMHELERKHPPRLAPRPPNSSDEQQAVVKPNPEEQKKETPKAKKNQLPRTDPLYQAKPGKDGYYHCPFFGKGEKSCKEGKHEPTKQKCTYDKYLDAHIKPYRCRYEECTNESFSSNAVLGRHIREMHLNGSRPLCRFPDCKRSIPGAGFRRGYNCWDHERRVHKQDVPYNGTDKPASRRRRGTQARKGPSMKKTTSSPGAMSTKSDPESQSSILTKIPENSTFQRRQSFPLEEPRSTPSAFSDLTDSDTLLDPNAYGPDWLSSYYAAEMDTEEVY